jgi:hypothetical protein
MSNTISTNATKIRKQSPVVARRKMLRAVVKRANIIAKNAYNVHNTSIKRIASYGAAISKNEFLSEAMSIAWKEQKTGQTIYDVQGKIPRKSMQDIHNALSNKVKQTNADPILTQEERHYEQARTMIFARNAGKYDESDITLAFNTAFDRAEDFTYALTA